MSTTLKADRQRKTRQARTDDEDSHESSSRVGARVRPVEPYPLQQLDVPLLVAFSSLLESASVTASARALGRTQCVARSTFSLVEKPRNPKNSWAGRMAARMRHRLSAVLALAALLATHDLGALDLPELATLAKPSVVLLRISNAAHERAGLGTGFFVSKGGRIVTNHHVIDGATKVVAALADGRTVDVLGALADDPTRDIAVLQVARGEYSPLPLGASTSLRVGDEIAIVGSPLGLTGSLSSGIVAAVRASGPPSAFDKADEKVASWGVQVTAAISAGSSGSPIMTRDGEVVAVAVGHFSGGEGLNFGVPIEVAESMLAGLTADSPPKPFAVGGRSEVLRNLGISVAVFGVPYLAYLVAAGWRRRRAAAKDRRAN